MGILILLLFPLEEILWPQPTPEIVAQIQLMGNENFATRELAQKNLEDKGFKALLAVKHGMRNDDAEIRRRCEEIYNNYFSAGPDVPILQLDFEGTVDSLKIISRDQAKELYIKEWTKEGFSETELEYDQDIAEAAMHNYIQQLLRKGTNRDLVKKLVEETQKRALPMPPIW